MDWEELERKYDSEIIRNLEDFDNVLLKYLENEIESLEVRVELEWLLNRFGRIRKEKV